MISYQYKATGLNGAVRYLTAPSEVEAMKLAKDCGLIAPEIERIKSAAEEQEEAYEMMSKMMRY